MYTSTAAAPTARTAAAAVILALCADRNHGARLTEFFHDVFAPQFDAALHAPDAEALVRMYDRDQATPLVAWDSNMRDDVRAMIAKELRPIDATIRANGTPSWSWKVRGARLHRPTRTSRSAPALRVWLAE